MARRVESNEYPSRYTSLGFPEYLCVEGWTGVRVSAGVSPEATLFVNSEAATGLYAIGLVPMISQGPTKGGFGLQHEYLFSDPNTAFQFRLLV